MDYLLSIKDIAVWLLKFIVCCLFVYALIGSTWERTEYHREVLLNWLEDIRDWYRSFRKP